MNFSGNLTEFLIIENDIKHGYLLGPTWSSIDFTIMIDSLKSCADGVEIQYHTTGESISFNRLQ